MILTAMESGLCKLIIHHMKKFTSYLVVFTALLTLGLGSCKKEDIVDRSGEYREQTDDQLFISAEIDIVTMDANSAVE